MSSKNVTITIINRSSILRSIATSVSIVAGVVAPIGVGAVLGSSAMEWVGFIFGLLFIVGVGMSVSKKNSFKTVEEAKARLDEMRAKGEAA